MKFTPGRTVVFVRSCLCSAASTPATTANRYAVEVGKGTLATVISPATTVVPTFRDRIRPLVASSHVLVDTHVLVYTWNRYAMRYILAELADLELADEQPPEDVRLAFEACVMADEPEAAIRVLEKSEQPRGGS